MAEWEKVAEVGEVPLGDMREIEAHGERLALANVDGTYYAFGAWCPHVGTSLALGYLSDCTVTCFAHLWRFDVRDGKILFPQFQGVAQGYNLPCYSVRVEGQDILVGPRLN
jgi:nitrite reductase (NADH) small subunit/3-phenylpropionate/trans-cinnamate dioxygenase ferredoxin subunit